MTATRLGITPRTIVRLLCLAIPLSLCACSDDELHISATSGGPEVPDTNPTGAVNMEVYATETQTCPPGNIHIDVGAVNASPPVFVKQGEPGTTLECAVVSATGKKFNASATIEKDTFAFAFSDVITDGGSAIGHVEFTDPKSGTRYSSGAAMPCVFQFAPGTAQGVNAGEIFVQFDCPSLVSAADPKSACSSRYGYIRLFNCSK